MESKASYTLVGLTVILLALGLLIAGLWLSVGFDKKKYNLYAVYMREAVLGLGDNSSVKFNGVRVGFVNRIELNHADPQQVKIILSIEEGTPITTSTSATLISQGITGTTVVGLSASSSDLTPLQKLPNQPYPVIPAKPSIFKQLDRVLKEVSENINTLSKRLQDILNPQNRKNIKDSLANIEKFTEVLAKNNQHINHLLKDSAVFFKNMSVASQQFPETINELRAGISTFASMSKAGKITIDKISEQTVPPVVTLLYRLNAVASNLEKISTEMKQNPAVIIRGTTPPPLGPGE